MKTKLTRHTVCHDVGATDPLNGDWHKGYSLPGSDIVAFYFGRAWYSSVPSKPKVDGPFKAKAAALAG